MQKQLYNDYIQTHFTQEKSSQCRGFQILLILDQWVISFHAMVLFGLGKNLLSKSVLGRCDVCTIALHIQSTRVSYSRWSTKQSMKGCQSFDLVKQKLESTFNSGIEFAIGFKQRASEQTHNLTAISSHSCFSLQGDFDCYVFFVFCFYQNKTYSTQKVKKTLKKIWCANFISIIEFLFLVQII